MSRRKNKHLKSPPLRNKTGQKRNEFIQFRVSLAEKSHAQKAFGKRLAHVIRSFLSGASVTEPCILDDDARRHLIQALYAHFKISERIFNAIKLGDINAALSLQTELDSTYKNLAKLCYSSSSK